MIRGRNYQEDFMILEKERIKEIYGDVNDVSCESYVKSDIAREFHQEYLRDHKIKSLSCRVRDEDLM